jgi:hypothetical protein
MRWADVVTKDIICRKKMIANTKLDPACTTFTALLRPVKLYITETCESRQLLVSQHKHDQFGAYVICRNITFIVCKHYVVFKACQ